MGILNPNVKWELFRSIQSKKNPKWLNPYIKAKEKFKHHGDDYIKCWRELYKDLMAEDGYPIEEWVYTYEYTLHKDGSYYSAWEDVMEDFFIPQRANNKG